jgi:hypothetical protein
VYPLEEKIHLASAQAVYDDLVKTAQRFAPRFKVISKDDSWLHRSIGFFSKLYKTEYWTTIGSTVAHPVGFNPAIGWKTIPHEGRHAVQAKKVSEPIFLFAYLLGHFAWAIIGLLLLLTVSIPLWATVNWWSGLIPLSVFLLVSPIPFAYFRYRWEKEAYTLSIAMEYWTTGHVTDIFLERMADQFVKWFYGWMWPFGRSSMRKKLKQARELVKSPSFLEDDYNRSVLAVLKKHSLVRAE